MCGIVGYLGAEIPSARFQAALAQLRHRGPYGEGSVALPHGGLAMTRLPMSSAAPTPLPVKTSQGYAAYNGEVYVRGADIHKEIALLLDGMAQGRLPDGMFALASWDAQRATLTLLRDGLGIKPLYYCYRPADGSLAFASEIKPLLTLVGQVAPDYGAIAELVATGVPLSEQTLFSGVRLLQPGRDWCSPWRTDGRSCSGAIASPARRRRRNCRWTRRWSARCHSAGRRFGRVRCC
ncbi:hypothetical protein GGER_21720 [Serratia rubidaea]